MANSCVLHSLRYRRGVQSHCDGPHDQVRATQIRGDLLPTSCVREKGCTSPKNESSFSANSTSRGHWEQHGRGCSSCGHTCRSRGRGFNNNSMRPHPQTCGNNSNKSNIDTRYKCQLGYKRGYTFLDYWHIFEKNFVLDESYNRCAAFYVVDSN